MSEMCAAVQMNNTHFKIIQIKLNEQWRNVYHDEFYRLFSC